ncbi:MAG: hypothetical protein NUV67_06265, partial [archaeon]|nr:hypothetical protein [archaeon]
MEATNMTRGVVFSLMVVLLLGATISLFLSSTDHSSEFSDAQSEMNAFRRVSDKYSNIQNNLSNLTLNEAEKQIDSRIIPFTYSSDANTFRIESSLPASKARIDYYLEALNSFGVFLED